MFFSVRKRVPSSPVDDFVDDFQVSVFSFWDSVWLSDLMDYPSNFLFLPFFKNIFISFIYLFLNFGRIGS